VTRGQFVFDERAEAESFVSALRYVLDLDELVLLNWALLSNHYHLAVRTTKIPLWKSMMRLQRRISRQYNIRQRCKGPFWQTRYRARLVLDSDYYQHLLAYITLNPVAAGLVRDPADWYWSGHRALVGMNSPLNINRSLALLEFDEEPENARQAYLDRIRLLAEIRGEQEMVEKLPWWRSAGSDYQTVAEAEIPEHAILFDGKPTAPEIPTPPLDLLLSICCEHSECTPESLRSTSRGEKELVARRALVKVAVQEYGYRPGEVARRLCKDRCTVSRWLSSTPRSTAESTLQKEIINTVAHRNLDL